MFIPIWGCAFIFLCLAVSFLFTGFNFIFKKKMDYVPANTEYRTYSLFIQQFSGKNTRVPLSARDVVEASIMASKIVNDFPTNGDIVVSVEIHLEFNIKQTAKGSSKPQIAVIPPTFATAFDNIPLDSLSIN